MSWNRANTEMKNASKSVRGSHRFAFVAGLALIIAVGFVITFFANDDKPCPLPIEVSSKRTIANVGTNKVMTMRKDDPKPLKPKSVPYWEVDASKTNGLTEVMMLKWHQVRRPRRPAVHVERIKQPYEIFEHRSENVIAGLICVDPGTSMIGTPVFGDRFIEDFVKSCKVPIVVKSDDSDYVKALKREVNAVKIDLINRYNNGEDLNKIMMDTHLELQRLGQVKREMETLVRESAKNAVTEDDVSDLVKAANLMLEEKGVSPIEETPLVRGNLKRMLRDQE